MTKCDILFEKEEYRWKEPDVNVVRFASYLKEKAGQKADSRYERPPLPRSGYKKSGAYCKEEAMGRPPVKGASIPTQDKPEKDIDVRQTGQDHDEEDGS